MNFGSTGNLSVVTPSQVQAFAGRTLDFLNAIEKTVDCLAGNTEMLYALSKEVQALLDRVKGKAYPTKLDPEGQVGKLLASGTSTDERMHQYAVAKRSAASADQRLQEADGVEAAYTDFIAAVSDHHDMLESLREWISVHDSLLEESTGKTYASVDDLFRAMGVRAA